MFILFIHQLFLSPKEAGSTRHFELAKYLVKKGNRVTIIAGNVSYLTGEVDPKHRRRFLVKENIEGVEIIRAKTYSKIHKSYVSRFFSFLSFMVSSIMGGIKSGKPDLVIACSPQIFTGISGFILSRIRRIPFIFEVRDLWPKFAIDTGVLTNPHLIYAATRLERFIYKKADYVIINSPGFFDHLESSGVGKEKIFLIPNGADTTIFTPGDKQNEVRKELGYRDEFVAMYMGAHGLANSLETIIESARLLKDHPEIQFLLVGDGNKKESLIKLAAEYALTNVKFIAAQSRYLIPQYCQAADVCLATLKKIDAFKTTYPNKLFDYMACGRPTILAIDGVARQVLEAAQGGEFVDPENPEELAKSLLKLYKNPSLCTQYGKNARKYVVENFDREKIADKLFHTLRDLPKKK